MIHYITISHAAEAVKQMINCIMISHAAETETTMQIPMKTYTSGAMVGDGMYGSQITRHDCH